MASNQEEMNVNVHIHTGECIQMSRKACVLSELFANQLDTLGDTECIPDLYVFDISLELMEKLKEFMELYVEVPMKKIEKPLKGTIMKILENEDSRYRIYLESIMDTEHHYDTLKKVINASHYMNVKPLLELCSATFASIIKENPNPETIRSIMGVHETSS
jgi:hypothetical protein